MTQTSAPPQGYDGGRAQLFSKRPPHLQVSPPQGLESGGTPPPTELEALVQTGTLSALVQTGTLSALVQTGVP